MAGQKSLLIPIIWDACLLACLLSPLSGGTHRSHVLGSDISADVEEGAAALGLGPVRYGLLLLGFPVSDFKNKNIGCAWRSGSQD